VGTVDLADISHLAAGRHHDERLIRFSLPEELANADVDAGEMRVFSAFHSECTAETVPTATISD